MKIINTSGKRKTAVARATLREGKGLIRVNKTPLDIYEPKLYRLRLREPMILAKELIDKVETKNTPVALYIFSWGKNEYKGEYSSINIRVEDIPEPIIDVYKEVNRLS